ncbi:dynactin subunit 3 [Ambystoma mexicanum]|uniref:dynactin subunit 3 n=1 Tax=Ambystoma mexicanum TaxID=8296 RepID=UPI0037E71268
METSVDFVKLQGRLENLETRVYGERRPGDGRGSAKIADGLMKVQSALANLAGKRERIKSLFKKIEDLKKYLDPEYIDRIAVPDAMKLEFILAEEQYILEHAALLEELSVLQSFLDSEHVKAVPGYATKLQKLSQIHIQQQDQSENINEETKKFLEDYNKMTLLLSKQFVQWDEMLTQMEAAQQVKQTLD